MHDAWQSLAENASTDAESAAVRLKKDIIAGRLAPNAKLLIRELIARYGIGASPMREALARLTGTGLVRLQGQKGFRVMPLSHADLADITRTRQIAESDALVLAIKAGDDFWEAEILKSFHLMCRELDRRGQGSDAWLDSFEARHHSFHNALIAACPLQSLKSFCNDLYLRMERYRRVLFGYAFEKVDVRSEHETLMKVVLSRKSEKASACLVAHVGLTADLLAALLPGDETTTNFRSILPPTHRRRTRNRRSP